VKGQKEPAVLKKELKDKIGNREDTLADRKLPIDCRTATAATITTRQRNCLDLVDSYLED